jgi:two-component system, response regulator RegA
MERQTVLIVDDDVPFRERLGRALTDRGYEVATAGTVAAALAAAQSDSPEFALVDLRLPDGSGLDVVRALLDIDASTHIVVLTGYGSIATAIEAVKLGARDYLTKPVDADQVVAAFHGTAHSTEATPEVTTPSLARVEWEHIQRVLADCGGNVSQAARVLGIHRRSLQRKLGKYPARR